MSQTKNGQPGLYKATLTAITDGDGAALAVDSLGRIITASGDAASDANYFHSTITSADAQTATPVKVKTAAKKIYVTSLLVSVGPTAMNIQLQSDNGTPQVVLENTYIGINGGLTWAAADKDLPLFVVDTNEDLDLITSAAGAVTVAVSGYVV